MARPVHRTARKDYPDSGIAKGDQYWYVKIKTGPRSSRVMRSKTPFRRSQLTQSDYLSQLYDWEDGKAAISSMDETQEFADTIRTLGEEQGEKLDNTPEGLQQGDSGQMLEARRDACEAAAGEIEEIVSEWESAKDAWESEIETYKANLEDYREQERKIDAEEDRSEDEELTEPDLPDHTLDNGDDAYEFDDDEFLDRVRDVSVDD
jgi:hypothetical protein